MKIFHAFLVILCSTILLFLPLTEAIDDFKTDIRSDTFYASGLITSTNVTLFKPVYEGDSSRISLLSDNSLDAPALSAYDAGTHSAIVAGLSSNTTRTLTVTYPMAAFTPTSAINKFFSNLYYVWLLLVFTFVPLCLVAIFTNRV